jgi:hypothetical protein
MVKKKLVNNCTLHRYIKVNIGRKKDYIVFRCQNAGCNHYVPRTLAENKVCQCNRCGEVMKLDSRAMLLEKPHCIDCVESRNKPEVDTPGLDIITEFLKNLENQS